MMIGTARWCAIGLWKCRRGPTASRTTRPCLCRTTATSCPLGGSAGGTSPTARVRTASSWSLTKSQNWPRRTSTRHCRWVVSRLVGWLVGFRSLSLATRVLTCVYMRECVCECVCVSVCERVSEVVSCASGFDRRSSMDSQRVLTHCKCPRISARSRLVMKMSSPGTPRAAAVLPTLRWWWWWWCPVVVVTLAALARLIRARATLAGVAAATGGGRDIVAGVSLSRSIAGSQ